MQNFVLKRWFLLSILAGIVIVWCCPSWLGWTFWVDPAVSAALVIFLSAWTLEGRSLWSAMLRPLPALWAALISYGFLPLMAWVGGQLLSHPDFRLGLILVACVPCTLTSAVIWTRLAGGSEAMALLITLLTNCTSWLATTAWLMLTTGIDGGAGATARLMAKLVLVLIVPVALGQLLRASGPLARVATRHRIPLGVLARLLTITIMLKAAIDVRGRLGDESVVMSAGSLLTVAGLCLGIHLAALGGGLWSSRRLGFDRPSQIAVAIAGSQKTLPLSLILFDAYFTSFPLAVVPMVFYHAGQLVADTIIADRLAGRRQSTAACG